MFRRFAVWAALLVGGPVFLVAFPPVSAPGPTLAFVREGPRLRLQGFSFHDAALELSEDTRAAETVELIPPRYRSALAGAMDPFEEESTRDYYFYAPLFLRSERLLAVVVPVFMRGAEKPFLRLLPSEERLVLGGVVFPRTRDRLVAEGWDSAVRTTPQGRRCWVVAGSLEGGALRMEQRVFFGIGRELVIVSGLTTEEQAEHLTGDLDGLVDAFDFYPMDDSRR